MSADFSGNSLLALGQPGRVGTVSAAQTNDPYLQKWLERNVVYIITEQERKSFEQLTNDKDRYLFIEEFWRKRDPTPGTEENEYRNEYYRRLAYVNERFKEDLSTDDKPGSQMDRGRIYILCGPPDQIESHPLGEPEHPQPFEIWRYPTLQFRFVSEEGRYKLVSASVQEKPTPGRLVRQIPRQTSGDRVIMVLKTRNHILTVHGDDANALYTVSTLDGGLLATNLDLTSLKERFPDLYDVATGWGGDTSMS